MKPEFKVKVFHKGAEFSFNGGPKQKAELYPPVVDLWIPNKNGGAIHFKTGRKKWKLNFERVK